MNDAQTENNGDGKMGEYQTHFWHTSNDILQTKGCVLIWWGFIPSYEPSNVELNI